jgi:hypothetical protein
MTHESDWLFNTASTASWTWTTKREGMAFQHCKHGVMDLDDQTRRNDSLTLHARESTGVDGKQEGLSVSTLHGDERLFIWDTIYISRTAQPFKRWKK